MLYDATLAGTNARYPGFYYNLKSVPADSAITVRLTPPEQWLAYYPIREVTSKTIIRGIEESRDRIYLTIYGDFDPQAPTFVYFQVGMAALPVEAVTVMVDRIVVDITKTDLAHWVSKIMPFTVLQLQGERGVCDTITFRYR